MTDAAIRAAQAAAATSPEAPRELPVGQSPAVQYVGLVSRTVAIAIDAAIINVVALVVGVATALITDTLGFPKQVMDVIAVIGGIVYTGWVILYFVTMWSVNAQTFGGRVMGFRVQHPDGKRPGVRRALVRFGAMVLAALPLGLGFVRVLFDDRRRGFHDRVANTVVIVGPGDAPAGARLTGRASGQDA